MAATTHAAAEEATRLAIQDLDKAASKGVIHKRNAARRKSRLMKQLRTQGRVKRLAHSSTINENQASDEAGGFASLG